MTDQSRMALTSSHWGTFRVETSDGRVTALHPFEEDIAPSPIGHGIVDVLDGPTRVTAPMVRESWLEHGPGTNGQLRGKERFVQVTWGKAEQLVADELNRVRQTHGNSAIYAGSYGWASAGRFHHAQSQMKRFLNCIGGFTKSLNTYSFAAGEVIVPHVLGDFRNLVYGATSWRSVIENTQLFVAFGGIPLKNGQIAQGGVGRHRQGEAMKQAHAAGVSFVNVSPLKSDVLDVDDSNWFALRPSSDTALMLALAHTLLSEDLHDSAFLDRYCTGFAHFADYLTGAADGTVKSADWAGAICDLPPGRIRELARRMAASRTMISLSWSLTRQEHGEQTYWAGIALAAMLGQIGLPGTGIGFGYSAVNSVGHDIPPLPFVSLPQGQNPVTDFIPVARISEMLENPGGQFDYNGQSYTYPDTKLIYWAGGNPFHHHQDLNRLCRAWARPDTIIANEWCWNALARHADIVLPCTTPLERSDIALTPRDPYVVRMDQAIEPVQGARNDHDIFGGIAEKMGVKEAFTEGRSPEDWQRWIYDMTRQQAARTGTELPTLEELNDKGWHRVPVPKAPHIMLSAFRADPEANPLATPSGKIEIYSEAIASFGYVDCPPHPAWIEPKEWLGAKAPAYPLHMISNQPKDKLHSQLDHGSHCRSGKVNGRTPVALNPIDAATRGISQGNTVRLFNDRGWCLAAAVIDDNLRRGVVQVSTGSWFDPAVDEDGKPGCKHGNPNVLTRDCGTSRLAQGPTAHSCLVEVCLFKGGDDMPPTPYDPPVIKN